MNQPVSASYVNENIRPTPAVVIAIGRFAAQSACHVRRIYLQGDARRAAACAFYQLAADDMLGLALVEMENNELVAAEPVCQNDTFDPKPQPTYLALREAALRCAIQHGSALRARLQRLLHEQRVHEKLIAAGWADRYDVPLNFFILADLNDPWAGGVLLPLAVIFNELSDSLCQVHWLFNTAVFPENAPEQDLAVWSMLAAFDDFLRPESQQRDAFASALNAQQQPLPDFAVYLFESHKEGTAVVKDSASLSILFGNALLALLQRDLARRFFKDRDEDAQFERGSYYSTIGAAGLVVDPGALQSACARRIAHSFLTGFILGPARDGQAAIEMANQLQEKLGGLAAWLDQLSGQLFPAVGQIHIPPDTLEMTALLTDLTLAPINYEHVRQTAWVDHFRSYASRFEQQALPEINDLVHHHSQQLETRLQEILRDMLDGLPIQAGLYPGGLDNARRMLAASAACFEKTSRDVSGLTVRIQAKQSAAAEKFETQCAQLQALLNGAPEMPWWLRLLPAFARQWVAPLNLLRRYGRQLYQIQVLRDACHALLQQRFGLRVEQLALEQIRAILPGLQTKTQADQVYLTALEEKLRQAAQAFSPDWGAFPLQAEDGTQTAWDALFRRPVIDLALANWADEQWRPDLAAWVQAFLAARPLFADWRGVEAGALTDWVREQAMRAYQPVWSLDLEKIFALWSAQAPGFLNVEGLSSQTIAACMSAAIPPVRPDFDAVGGANGSSVTFHALMGSPDWQICCLPSTQERKASWQAVYTGDPYSALFIQVRHNIPLWSLIDSFHSAHLRLESLPDDQRDQFRLLPVAALPTDLPDANDADQVHKVFAWKFKPKGSSKEIEQAIELALSRSRFEYYRRQPRLSGQWNAYAELEMPEVRDLACAFQQLHAHQRWNTFNQAYNVLKFVQSCVPYSYDRDTTGHEDWARYPIETLMEGTGDCEDLAILCAAVIARLGFQVVLLLYPNHLAFGVAGADHLKGDYLEDPRSGLHYFYGEATANGWRLGEIPKAYLTTPVLQILPVNILIEEETCAQPEGSQRRVTL